jgi:AraC family transcriptional regulator
MSTGTGAAGSPLESLAIDALAAVGDLVGRGAGPATPPPSWLAILRERLDDVGDESVRDLAAAAGVHPVYLARQFRRHFGCSVTEYVQRRRLQRAARRLAETSAPLSHVAHAVGYADHAHMCRAFRDAAGATPSEYRTLAAG